MIIFTFIGVFLILYGIVYFVIGSPLVVYEKIQDYRKGVMSNIEKKQWQWVLIIWSIVLILSSIIIAKVS
jgi:hypothetical protein